MYELTDEAEAALAYAMMHRAGFPLNFDDAERPSSPFLELRNAGFIKMETDMGHSLVVLFEILPSGIEHYQKVIRSRRAFAPLEESADELLAVIAANRNLRKSGRTGSLFEEDCERAEDFRSLSRTGLLDVFWADDKAYKYEITDKGLSYIKGWNESGETQIEETPASGFIQLGADNYNLQNLIYTIRSRQVMLDSDLAALYGVETKTFNQAVKRNGARFPERYRFQLTDKEFETLRSQFVTSKARGGRRYNPYVFTEQGVAMLSSVLRSDTAVSTSIAIMDAFVDMRRFHANNAGLLQRIDVIEGRQIEYQQRTDERLEQVFGYLEASDTKEALQTIFFDGQIYDAFKILAELVEKAKRRIVLVDSYIDVRTLNILMKKRENVCVSLYTTKRGKKLTENDVEAFNAQYPLLEVKLIDTFHDRFLILDDTEGYLIGASLKDAGKKCFGLSKIEDPNSIGAILDKLK